MIKTILMSILAMVYFLTPAWMFLGLAWHWKQHDKRRDEEDRRMGRVRPSLRPAIN